VVAVSLKDNQTVLVRAVVIADYQGNLQRGGFYVQEVAADADAATGEGIFVYCDPDGPFSFQNNANDIRNPRECAIDVAVGDLVEVSGTVQEIREETRINAVHGTISVISRANPLPEPVVLNLAQDLIGAGVTRAAFYEPYEGMLVTIADPLSVAEYFQLARFGEVVLYQGGRPFQYTHVDDTPTDAEFAAFNADLERRRLVLDDDSSVENVPLVRSPQTLFYPMPGGLSTGAPGTDFFRGGDTITGLTGILSFGFGNWRMLPVATLPPVFTVVNPRSATPPNVGGTLTIASFNVLNYFTTLGSRGASSPAELERQAEKIVAALTAIDAAVYGLMEIENNVTAVADLVARLNAVAGTDAYAFIDTGVIGTDEIAVALIYQPARVTPVGVTAVLDAPAFVNPFNADTDRNRPAVAQTFRDNASGAAFTVVVNHLKSKGSTCGAGDDDPLQGSCNGTRTAAAQQLVNWLASDPTGTGEQAILLIGDMNAYAGEDPIDALRSGAGSLQFVDLQGGVNSENYSYVFDGMLGYLDHALASTILAPHVVGVAEWHINADEVPVFDYNDEVRDPGENEYEEEPDANPLYESSPFRASDHDPVIIGLAFPPAEPTPEITPTSTPDVTATDEPDASSTIDVDVSGAEGDIMVSICVEDADTVTIRVQTDEALITLIYGADQCE
ncbi:MAG: ExeM/NucH family extracellular endonuclease, partial [Anaerolineae bacterium]|nr:ExeM/NucH family extracellular endonuclease [Anaerolineae bacterium]